LPSLKPRCEKLAKNLAKSIDKITKHADYQHLKDAIIAGDKSDFEMILRNMGIDQDIEYLLVEHCLDTGSVSFTWV